MSFERRVNTSPLPINNLHPLTLPLFLSLFITPSALLSLSSHYAQTQLIYEILKSSSAGPESILEWNLETAVPRVQGTIMVLLSAL